MSWRPRRNRRVKVDGFLLPRPFAGIVVFVAATALVFLWLSSRSEALGREIEKLEQEQARLNKKLLNEEYKWSRLKSPKHIEETLARYGIEMSWPNRDQVIWLAHRTHGTEEAMALRLPEVSHRYAGITRQRRDE